MGVRVAEPYREDPEHITTNAHSTALPAWYAVQTRPPHEQGCSLPLDQDGMENLLPLTSEVHQGSDREKVVPVPLFPAYVFVRMPLLSNEQRVRVLRKMGVISFVGPKRDATPITASQIENVRALMTARA